jgi:hypothetical protein
MDFWTTHRRPRSDPEKPRLTNRPNLTTIGPMKREIAPALLNGLIIIGLRRYPWEV